MIKGSRAATSSLSSTPAVRRTPLPHLCAHLTPYTTLVMGANAMHHLPNKARANHLNPGFVTRVRESLTLQCYRTSRLSSYDALVAKTEACSGEQRTIVSRCWLYDITAISLRLLHTIRTHFVLDSITRAIVVNKVITNYTTGRPILHIEASFISVEKGLRREILSRTSLKYYI